MQGSGAWFVTGHFFPIGQLEHTPSPAKEYVPGVQVFAIPEAVGHSEPAGHGLQVVYYCKIW